MIKGRIVDFLDDHHAIVRFDIPSCFEGGQWIGCRPTSPRNQTDDSEPPLLQEIRRLIDELNNSVEEVTQLIDQTLGSEDGGLPSTEG